MKNDNLPTYSTVSAFNFLSSPGDIFFIGLPPSTSSVPCCESLERERDRERRQQQKKNMESLKIKKVSGRMHK